MAGFGGLKRRIAAGDWFHFLSLAFLLQKEDGWQTQLSFRNDFDGQTRNYTVQWEMSENGKKLSLDISIELVVNVGTHIFVCIVQLYSAENMGKKQLLKCDRLFVVFIVFKP